MGGLALGLGVAPSCGQMPVSGEGSLPAPIVTAPAPAYDLGAFTLLWRASIPVGEPGFVAFEHGTIGSDVVAVTTSGVVMTQNSGGLAQHQVAGLDLKDGQAHQVTLSYNGTYDSTSLRIDGADQVLGATPQAADSGTDPISDASSVLGTLLGFAVYPYVPDTPTREALEAAL